MKAPDYSWPDELLQVEYTELSRSSNDRTRAAGMKRVLAILDSSDISWPSGVFHVEVRTWDWRRVRKLVDAGELQAMVSRAPSLTAVQWNLQNTSQLRSTIKAYHQLDPRFYAHAGDVEIIISKRADDGRGFTSHGLLELSPPGQTMFVPEAALQRMSEYLAESNEKFRWNSGATSVLLLDIQNYVAGPLLVKGLLDSMDLAEYPAIDEMFLVFDHPYTEPPLEVGILNGLHRFWSIPTDPPGRLK